MFLQRHHGACRAASAAGADRASDMRVGARTHPTDLALLCPTQAAPSPGLRRRKSESHVRVKSQNRTP